MLYCKVRVFALKTNKATRLKEINCLLRAWGNDTVSPWTGATGMYYFKDCTMIGGTDFYCPHYYGCRKDGKQYEWYKDNLATAPGAPAASAINAKWTFEGKWEPIKKF